MSKQFDLGVAGALDPGECFRLIFETAYQFIGLLDAQGTMLEVNRSALAWVRIPREAVVGRPVWDTPWWTRAGDTVLDRLKAAVASAREGQFVRYDVTLPSIDGPEHTFDLSLTPVANNEGQVVLLVAEGRDITEQKRLEHALREANGQLQLAQEQARQLAITDELTGLYNRRGFFIMAERHKQIAVRARARGFLMFVDVDGLKQANDEHGHDLGDALIGAAARVLVGSFRSGDLVARIGGDEFAVMAMLSAGESTSAFEDRLAANLEVFNAQAALRIPLCMSIGVHEFEWTSELAIEALVSRADAAMYEQKRRKKG